MDPLHWRRVPRRRRRHQLPLLVGDGACQRAGDRGILEHRHRVKEFYAWMLTLQTAMYGVFLALDYVLFFIFWELLLVPMYFIIGIWGGERREYAAIKFFIYTLVGSAIMLVGILAFYLPTVRETFNILALAEAAQGIDPRLAFWLFLAFSFGFAVKVPVWPFHTWLPDAHVEAPTGGSMILAGVLLKTGTYGFFRIAYPTFPEVPAVSLWSLAFSPPSTSSTALWRPWRRRTSRSWSPIRRSATWASSCSAWPRVREMSMNGAMYVMISHGVISPLLFFLVGSVFYDRVHTRMMGDMGGLFVKMPVAATILAFAAFANLGPSGAVRFRRRILHARRQL